MYRMFSADGTLVYVGCTGNVPKRLDLHRSATPWWDDVATVTVQHFPNRRSALDAEAQAIRSESPRYNRYYNGADPIASRRVPTDSADLFARWRDGETLEAIGQDRGCSRERVRQVIAAGQPDWLISLVHQLHLTRTKQRRAAERIARDVDRLRCCFICGDAHLAGAKTRSARFSACRVHLGIAWQVATAIDPERYQAHKASPSLRGSYTGTRGRWFVHGSAVDRVVREAIDKDWPLAALLTPELRAKVVA